MRRNRCRHICAPAGSGHRPTVISGRNDGRRYIRFRRQLPQMLDAAHGKAVAMARKVQRRDGAFAELKQRGTRIAHSVGRRTPTEAGFHIGRQSPVRHVAVARSRRCEAIAMRNAAESAEQWFLLRMSLRRSSALLSRAGRSLPQRRPASVPRRLRPTPRQTYFVILSGADRRTQRAQRPLADYASQGIERQTKCSQESMTNNKESDSSSLCSSE